MKTAVLPLALAPVILAATPAQARSTIDVSDPGGGTGKELPAVLQCVPYARELSGIQIYGDAHTWWSQAQGRYHRGSRPRVGAVMAVRPYANSRLGHVAYVSGVIDARTILLRHANWSQPGGIERDVQALDVSPANDWSEVRIWYGPTQSLGTTHWPLYGFIYNDRPGQAPRAERTRIASAPDPIGDIIAGRFR